MIAGALVLGIFCSKIDGRFDQILILSLYIEFLWDAWRESRRDLPSSSKLLLLKRERFLYKVLLLRFN